jgi:hypothetical protein
MKCLSMLIALCFCFISAKTQSVEIYDTYIGDPIGDNLAGTKVELNCAGFWDCETVYYIKNKTGELINICLERHKLIDASGSEDYVLFWTYS